MGQKYAKKEEKLSTKIFTDEEYFETVENTDLHDKIKGIISEHVPFTGPEKIGRASCRERV